MKKYVFFLLPFFWNQAFSQQLDNEKVLDYIQNQRFGEAADYIKSSYPGGITDNKIIARLGYLYYMNGNLPEAEKNYLLLLGKDSLNKSIMMSLAQINNRRGNYFAAADYYKKILKQDSSIFNVYKQLADIAQITRDTNSVFYLQKANKLNPADGDVAYDLSDVYILQEKYVAADSVLSAAIKTDTTNLILYRNKTKLAYVTKKYKDVIVLCDKLLNGGDKTSTVYKWFGNSLYYTRNYQKSIDVFLEMEENEELQEDALSILARDYEALGNITKALEYFEKAIKAGSEVSPNLFFYYYKSGDMYRSLKKYRNAVAAYEKSQQYQELPFANYLIGLLYDQELKNKTSALKYYRKFIEVMAKKDEHNEYISYAKSRVAELTR